MQGKASHGTRFDQRLPLERDFDIQFPAEHGWARFDHDRANFELQLVLLHKPWQPCFKVPTDSHH